MTGQSSSRTGKPTRPSAVWFTSFPKRDEAARRAGLERVADNLDATIGTIVTKLQGTAGDILQGARVLATNVQETDAVSAGVADASREASANVQMISSAATDFSTSIREVAMQSDRSAQIAQRARADATRASTAIGGVTDATETIGEAVHLIAAISSQTNLLALNATIEAGRWPCQWLHLCR